MEYRGYIGQVTYDPEAKIYFGEVAGMRDVITFQGETPEEAEREFRNSVDDYLEFCKELNEKEKVPTKHKLS